MDVDGWTIACTDAGDGPPLVLLHGAPTTSYVYRHVITELGDHFRCIAPDLPGWGDSPAPDGFEPRLPVVADQIQCFVRALDAGPVILAVMDTAGAPGVRVVQRAPGLFRGLIVADTFVYPASEYPGVRRMLGLATSRPFAALNRRFNLLPRLVRRFGGRGRSLTAAEKSAYDRDFPDAASRDRIVAALRDLRENDAFMQPLRDAIPEIDLPVLLLYGEHDPMRKVGVQDRLERELPNATSVVIPGEAHFPHEGDPEGLARAVLGWAWREGIATSGRPEAS